MLKFYRCEDHNKNFLVEFMVNYHLEKKGVKILHFSTIEHLKGDKKIDFLAIMKSELLTFYSCKVRRTLWVANWSQKISLHVMIVGLFDALYIS